MSEQVVDLSGQFAFTLVYQNGHRDSIIRSLPCHVGRGDHNHIRVKNWRVSKSHARFFQLAESVYVEDYGSITGTYLNQKRISRAGPLDPRDEIIIGTCKLSVRLAKHQPDAQSPAAVQASDALRLNESKSMNPHAVDKHEQDIVTPITVFNLAPANAKDFVCTRSRLRAQSPESPPVHLVIQANQAIFEKLRQSLFIDLDVRKQDITGMSANELKQFANQLLEHTVEREYKHVEQQLMRQLISSVLDEAFGYGLIEPLLSDPDVTEIMINQFDKVFVERQGSIHSHPLSFSSEVALRTVIDRMLQSAGKRVDEGSPMSDARLNCGSRLNAVIPPISFKGACLTLRKFPETTISLDSMVEGKSLTREMADHLKNSVRNRKSCLVSGGTGTGKTTLLNALIAAIPPFERLITIEDAAELRIFNPVNHVSLETRTKNIEGQGEVTIRDLVRNALRMRPDRIIIGECRGGEALDMLSAMNTGHEGSMTTLHANSPRDAISRLETMVLMAQHGLPIAAIREQISSAIDLIVQLKRLESGQRVISTITEVIGMESGVLQLQDLHVFHVDTRFDIGGNLH